jgi:hypothetical protein
MPISSNPPAEYSARTGTAEYSVPGTGGVTPRIVALCLALAAFFGYVIPIIDVKLANTFLGAQHLPPGAVGALLVLLLALNPLLRQVAARPAVRYGLIGAGVLCLLLAWYGYRTGAAAGLALWTGVAGAVLLLLGALFGQPLARNEALVVYISCLFSCLVPGHGAENFLVSNIVAPFYFATPENRWLDFLLPHLPAWSSPVLWADPSQSAGTTLSAAGSRVANGFYDGGMAVPWLAWSVPLLVWGAMCLLLYTMLGCFAVMLHEQWAEREALAFPLNQLPLEMTAEMDRPGALFGSFFTNRLMWLGFALAAVMQMLNGLHLYFPDVPAIVWNLDTGPLFAEAPWNQMGWTPIQIYPIAIGVSYLLTSEISFSLWFFALLMRFEFIGSYLLGYPPNAVQGGRDFTTFQTVGAFLAYAALVLWTARHHLRHVARRALGLDAAGPHERDGFLSYPQAFWGFVFSSLGLLGLTCLMGVRPLLAVGLWAFYLVTAIGLTRLVVEGGMLYVGNLWRPLPIIAQLTNGSAQSWLPASTVAPAAVVQGAFMTDMRAFLLPSFVQGFKLAEENGIRRRPLLGLIAAIITLTLAMGLLMRVRLGYADGALGFHPFFAKDGPLLAPRTTQTVLAGVPHVSWTNWFWLIVGAALTWGMMLARSRFLWFPLHPLGYLIPLSYPLLTLWFSIFCGWTAKTIITRYGGHDAYRAARAGFLGLALGDIAMMLFWLLVDGWQGRTFHYLVPS